MNRAQRIVLLIGLAVLLSALGTLLVPFELVQPGRDRCRMAVVSVFETFVPLNNGGGMPLGMPVFIPSRDWFASPQPPVVRSEGSRGPYRTVCADAALERFQFAGVIGGLGIVGSVGAFMVLREQRKG